MNNNTGPQITKRYSNLDVIKGICILMVVFSHYNWSDEQRLALLFPFWIDMAVPVFMVITGYVSHMSYNRKGTDSLIAALSPAEVIAKCLRYVIPFLPVYIIREAAYCIGTHNSLSIGSLALNFITGGNGPGSYYFPVMIQLMLIIPVITFCADKYPAKALTGSFLLTVLFEAICTFLHISDGLYRLLCFRYLFIISFGSYLYSTDCKKNKAYWAACLMGAAYICLFVYMGIKHIFINAAWGGTSVFAVLFIFPFIREGVSQKGIHNRILELLGKASYNIYLVQMVYYLAARRLYSYIPFVPLRIAMNMTICCTIGFLFHKAEHPITSRIIHKIRGNYESGLGGESDQQKTKE